MSGVPQGPLFRRSSGFSTDPHCERMTVELNLTSWPPLCSSHDFSPCHCTALVSQLLCWCRLPVTFASLVFSCALSRILLWLVGALLIATKDPQCCALLFSYKYRKYLFSLVQLCDLLLIFFLLYCVIMLIQMYANTLWVWILMFLYSCSACVCSPRC